MENISISTAFKVSYLAGQIGTVTLTSRVFATALGGLNVYLVRSQRCTRLQWFFHIATGTVNLSVPSLFCDDQEVVGDQTDSTVRSSTYVEPYITSYLSPSNRFHENPFTTHSPPMKINLRNSKKHIVKNIKNRYNTMVQTWETYGDLSFRRDSDAMTHRQIRQNLSLAEPIFRQKRATNAMNSEVRWKAVSFPKNETITTITVDHGIHA